MISKQYTDILFPVGADGKMAYMVAVFTSRIYQNKSEVARAEVLENNWREEFN